MGYQNSDDTVSKLAETYGKPGMDTLYGIPWMDIPHGIPGMDTQ